MREDLPAGVLDMLRIPGLRQERVRKLYKELGIVSAADLEDAAQSGRLAATKGFGAAFQAKVLQGIEVSRGPQGRHLIAPTRLCASRPMRSPVVLRLLAI
jgi:DNA polymerase (family X)